MTHSLGRVWSAGFTEQVWRYNRSMKKAFVLPATALEKDSVMPWIALTPATIRAGMAVHPSNARTLLPERFMGFTAKRFIHNERGQHCTVLADGSHEVSCVVTDTLWTKSV